MIHDHEHEQLHEPGFEHVHSHDHAHAHPHEHGSDGSHPHVHSGEEGHEHVHTHAHPHEHGHSHEHTHADGVVHTHPHSHEHSHEHSHTHSHGEVAGFDSVEQAAALMGYMLEHNRHHAEELHELCHKLEATGKAEAAAKIHDAVDRFGEGNALLESALADLKQE